MFVLKPVLNASAYYVNVFFISIVFCICLHGSSAYAQEPNSSIINEVIQIGDIPTLKDTTRIKEWITKGDKEKITAPDSALFLFRKALAYSLPIHFRKGILNSLIDIGFYYFNKASYQQAKNLFFQSERYASASEKLVPIIYSDLGAVYSMQGVYDSAFYFYYRALDEFNKRKSTDSVLFLRLYGNLGATLMDMGQINQAFYYLNTAKQLALLYKNYNLLSHAYSNIGTAYRVEGHHDSALYYFHNALRLDLSNNNYDNAQENYFNIGALLLEEKKPRQAKLYFDSAVSMNKANAQNKASMQRAFGAVYLQLKDYKKALFYYKRALAICNKTAILRDKIDIYYTLSYIYKKTGQLNLAYKYLKDLAELKDQLSDKEKINAINQLEVKYRTAQKDKVIATTQAEIIRRDAMLKQKNWTIAAITAIVLFVITISLILVWSNKRKQLLRLHAIEQEQKINQLNASISGEEKERSRIARELHDGIMVQLSVIKMNLKTLPQPYKELEHTDYYKQLIQQMEAATAELRQTAHNLMPDMLLQEGLTQAILYFCTTLSKNTGLQISFRPEGPTLPRLQPEFELAVYRIVQELVQNILKHAHATAAIVQLLNYQNELLTITVEDNGKGFNTSSSKSDGQGLTNIKIRVASLGGTFDLQSDSESGTTVHLEFELHQVHSNNLIYGNNSNNSG